MARNNSNTSWGNVADWYDEHLEQDPDTYQRQVILPNLLRLLRLEKGEKVLDLACGSGFFARELAQAGAEVTGVDLSSELIRLAKQRDAQIINYRVSSADKLDFLENNSFGKVIIILALQNIENVAGVLSEVARVLKPGGELLFVINHPVLRIPGGSTWGWDAVRKVQYRRLDNYMSETKSRIAMQPSKLESSENTVSFHRPLQYYFKLLDKSGLAVSRLEEWISHKSSEPGPRKIAEDRARHEFPLFLCLIAKKV